MKWVRCFTPLTRWQTIVGAKYYSRVFYALPENVTLPNNVYGLTFQNLQHPTITVRNYAKGKDKKKEKGKHKTAIDERMLSEVIPLDDIKSQMQKAVDRLKEEYVQSLSLRSSTGAIENLHVSFEGKDYSLQELGQVVRKDSKTVIVNMIAFPQAISAVLKALQKSGMNLNPQQDGTTLYIPVPRVTTEHRAQLAKNAKTLFIQCRDAVKNVQLKHEKKLKNSSLAQDVIFNVQQQLGALAENYITQADSLHQIKVKELSGKDS